MGALSFDELSEQALLLLDSPPIIYVVEEHPKLSSRFEPLFTAHAAGQLRFAVTTIGIAEVLAGPFRHNDEVLARRYKAVMESWQVVPLTSEIAEGAARLRASLGLKLSDAIHAASALSINAAALVTHDRDFSRVRTLRVIS